MKPRALYILFILVCAVGLGQGAAGAQDQTTSPAVAPFSIEAPPEKPADLQVVPLTVPTGVPLHVILEKPLPIKHTGVPVAGRVVEPIYVFDHLVIPSGSELLGHVSKIDSPSRGKRALDIANGDFTPHHTAHVDFDTLVLKDGRRIPIQTAVTQGAPELVHLVAGGEGKKKGRVSQAVSQAEAQAKATEHQTVQELKSPGKLDHAEAWLIEQLPYHPEKLPAGTSFTAELKKPLDLGSEQSTPKELEQLGAKIPSGSNVHVRLVTALSSATDHQGKAVEAVVSQPVFSPDHHLILPEGTRLEGTVTQAVPARRLGRNGQLRFTFRQVELAHGVTERVEASLQSVNAATGAHMKLDSEGGAHAVTPKTKYIMPAIDVFLAATSLDMDGEHHPGAGTPVAQPGADVAGGAVRGAAGLGLVGSVIGMLVHYRPVSAGFAFYGAGWAVYTHVVARGNDVVFAKNTPMDIRFGTHDGAASPGALKTPAPVKPSTL
ncbi:MAG TPA: hypothetical protein VMT20_26605 [Terriglobia bacterium]|nr:hypothetical protein [Terriglobia bacterium]